MTTKRDVPGKVLSGKFVLFRRLPFYVFAIALPLTVAPHVSAADEVRFLGAPSCASAMCHGGADEQHNQWWTWSNKDFHTRGPATLVMARSTRMAETLKMGDASRESRCTVCHNPLATVPVTLKDTRISAVEGVSCETCHNAAPSWLLTHTRRDLTYLDKVSAGMRDLKNLYVRANTCVACHQNLDADIRAAGHPELIFEMDGMTADMPRHWTETNRWRGAQAWQVGQLVALREAEAQGEKGLADATTRAAALQWLLEVKPGTADEFARQVSTAIWGRNDAVAEIKRLLARGRAFSEPSVAPEELVQRAERLMLGLDRILVSLQLHRHEEISPQLDRLFRTVQSRRDFNATDFSAEMAQLATVVGSKIEPGSDR